MGEIILLWIIILSPMICYALFINVWNILAMLMSLLVALLLCGLYATIRGKEKDGKLLIDSSNAEKDIYRLELNTDLDELKEKKKIVLEVQNDAILQ